MLFGFSSFEVVGLNEYEVEVADDPAEVNCKIVSGNNIRFSVQSLSYCQRLPSWRPLQGRPFLNTTIRRSTVVD
jgi:hypothetical protein